MPNHRPAPPTRIILCSFTSHSTPKLLLQLTGERAKISAAVEVVRTTTAGGNTYFAPAFQIVSNMLVDSTAIAAIFFVTGAR